MILSQVGLRKVLGPLRRKMNEVLNQNISLALIQYPFPSQSSNKLKNLFFTFISQNPSRTELSKQHWPTIRASSPLQKGIIKILQRRIQSLAMSIDFQLATKAVEFLGYILSLLMVMAITIPYFSPRTVSKLTQPVDSLKLYKWMIIISRHSSPSWVEM